MATAPATQSFDLSKADRQLLVRSLETQVSVIARQMRAEPDDDIKAIRQVQIDAHQAMIARFR